MRSLIITRREQATPIPNCRCRSARVPVCIVPLQHRFLWPFGTWRVWQQFEKSSLVAVSRWSHRPVTSLLTSSSPAGLITIAITSQSVRHRAHLPAVSSLTAYSTPAR